MATFMYSASHPEGRIFSDDEMADLGPEWVDAPGKVAQSMSVDLTASDEELAEHDKADLEKAAREELGLELDRRKSVRNMIAEIRKAQG